MYNAFEFETINIFELIKLDNIRYSKDAHNNPKIRAVCTLEAGAVRYRYDGGTPTQTSGHLLSHGDKIELEGIVNIENFRAVNVGDREGVLSVTYERG